MTESALSPALPESVFEDLVNMEKVFLEDGEQAYLPILRAGKERLLRYSGNGRNRPSFCLILT